MTHGAEYIPVYDARKAKIQGLWQRGSKYYARLKIAYPGEDHPKVRRVPLKGTTVANVRKELNALRVSSEKGQTTVRERPPLLADYAPEYIRRIEEGNRKRPRSINTKRGHAKFWVKVLGRRRLHSITPGMIQKGLDERAGTGISPRTLNLALTTLRNIFAEAISDALVDSSPCDNVKWRKVDKKERRLVTTDEFDRLCDAALKD